MDIVPIYFNHSTNETVKRDNDLDMPRIIKLPVIPRRTAKVSFQNLSGINSYMIEKPIVITIQRIEYRYIACSIHDFRATHIPDTKKIEFKQNCSIQKYSGAVSQKASPSERRDNSTKRFPALKSGAILNIKNKS